MSIVGVVALALALSQGAGPKGWRGIVPLHSTRADVERLLSERSLLQAPHVSQYDLETERVYIFYETRPCSEGGQWDVPSGTVTSISVTPEGGLKLPDLRLDLKEYERSEGMHSRTYYRNKEAGVSYEVLEPEGWIMEVDYRPAAKDEHLRCPDLSPPAPPCIRPPHLCPFAMLNVRRQPCPGSVHELAASIGNVDPDDTLTFEWAVSAGEIKSGQGTTAVNVDTAAAGQEPVIVKFKAVSSLCEACEIEDSYTIEPCPKGKDAEGGGRKPGAPTRP